MSLVLILYLIAPLVLVAFMYQAGSRSLRTLITIPAALYSLPVIVVFGVYLLRAPIQQGKFLGQLGPVLSLIFPPEDLYTPLVSAALLSDRKEYTLSFTHKYVGHHAVEISVPGRSAIGKLEPELMVSLEVYQGETVLYRNGPVKGSRFWGKERHGLSFSRYRVPEDLPVSSPLTAKVVVRGDLGGFLTGRTGAMLSIKKMSDE